MAKKTKQKKTNAIRLIEQQKIAYTEQSFPWDEEHLDALTAAANLGVAPDELFKTLLTVGTQTGPVVAVIPSNQELNLKALAKVSGNKKIEMLHLKELEATTGYIRGGCSPIGMKKLFPTYIDESAATKNKIYISAGRRGAQIGLAPTDLAAVAKGTFAPIAVTI